MPGLAVFDIDGTLCDTNAVDDSCFVQAVGEFLQVDSSQLDWSAAPDIPDSGLLNCLRKPWPRCARVSGCRSRHESFCRPAARPVEIGSRSFPTNSGRRSGDGFPSRAWLGCRIRYRGLVALRTDQAFVPGCRSPATEDFALDVSATCCRPSCEEIIQTP
jgi:hypothetical protein